jgi:deoxyribose-phosphate aldolase
MQPEPPPPPAAYEHVAGLIDHTLLGPALTSVEVIEGLELARRSKVASATVRPCDVEVAVRALEGSPVKPGSVVGFPHGSQSTAVKLYEARDLLRRGAREIDAVIAISRLLSREFQYVQTELQQMADACHKEGAILKAIFETAYLTDELKIIACRMAERTGVDIIAASTGFAPSGGTIEDLLLLRRHAPGTIGVKAEGASTLDQVLEARQAGATRIGVTQTAAILKDWKARLAGAGPGRPS